MPFSGSSTCVHIRPFRIHMNWNVSVRVCMQRLWFRILVFHLICMRIHNKIILVTLLKCLLRTECNQWLFCRFCFHAQILTALVHKHTHSLSLSIYLSISVSFRSRGTEWFHAFGIFILVFRNIYLGCCHQQIHYTILLKHFMFSSCCFSLKQAKYWFGRLQMICCYVVLFNRLKSTHQKIILSQLFCCLNRCMVFVGGAFVLFYFPMKWVFTHQLFGA